MSVGLAATSNMLAIVGALEQTCCRQTVRWGAHLCGGGGALPTRSGRVAGAQCTRSYPQKPVTATDAETECLRAHAPPSWVQRSCPRCPGCSCGKSLAGGQTGRAPSTWRQAGTHHARPQRPHTQMHKGLPLRNCQRLTPQQGCEAAGASSPAHAPRRPLTRCKWPEPPGGAA